LRGIYGDRSRRVLVAPSENTINSYYFSFASSLHLIRPRLRFLSRYVTAFLVGSVLYIWQFVSLLFMFTGPCILYQCQ